MFNILQNIGSLISRIGFIFSTIWDNAVSVFKYLWSILASLFTIFVGFPVWLAGLIVAVCVVSCILWLTFNR